MSRSDQALIQGYLKGNQREFLIISNWINLVVKNEYWGLKDYWADIIQDVRMKVYINLEQKKFRQSSKLKTYVFRIAKYTCIDYLRRKYRTEEVSIENTEIADDKDQFKSLVRKEQEHLLRQIFIQLTQTCRQILKMAFIQKLSYKKIASLLGIAEGTVKSRVARCIEKAIQLRAEFAE